MRHLRSLSVVMTAAGVLLVLAAALFDLGATWILIGLLLAWAGVVKVVVVYLWRDVAAPPAAVGKDDRGRAGLDRGA